MSELNLSSYAFFKGMKRPHLALLSCHAVRETFRINDYLFQERQEASKFYLILKGQISIEVISPEGKQFSIQVLKQGDTLGWSWLIPPHEWRFSARAMESTEVLTMDGEYLRKKCRKDHDLGYELFRRLAGVFVQRLEATLRQLVEMYHAV